MKQLNQYINEKFKLSSKNIGSKYKYHPKDRKELKLIIDKELENQQGFDIIVDLNMIDVSKITDLSYIFSTLDYNTKIDVSEWDVSKVNSFKGLFVELEEFDCDLSNWDVSNGRNFQTMFRNCTNFTGKGLENWNMSKADNIQFIFTYDHNLNFDYESWFDKLKNKELKSQLIDSLDSCKQIKKELIEQYKKKYL